MLERRANLCISAMGHRNDKAASVVRQAKLSPFWEYAAVRLREHKCSSLLPTTAGSLPAQP